MSSDLRCPLCKQRYGSIDTWCYPPPEDMDGIPGWEDGNCETHDAIIHPDGTWSYRKTTPH